jgi:hypothetical protein
MKVEKRSRNVDYSVSFDADQSLRSRILPSHVVNILYFNDFPFPKSWKFAKCRGHRGGNFNSQYSPGSGEITKILTLIVKMLISPPCPGGLGFNWLVHKRINDQSKTAPVIPTSQARVFTFARRYSSAVRKQSLFSKDPSLPGCRYPFEPWIDATPARLAVWFQLESSKRFGFPCLFSHTRTNMLT